MFGLNSKKWVKESQKTEKETKKLAGSSYNIWKNVIKNYNEAFNAFTLNHMNDLDSLKNSMVYFEMVSFTKRLSLIQSLALWGYYHSSLQELRFLMETTTLAYYLDQQLPNTDYSEKIKLMQKHRGELWGERLRRRAYMYEKDFGTEIEKIITEVNDSIDEYLADNKVVAWSESRLPYNENELNQCVRHSKNICTLIMKHYSKLFPDFDYKGDSSITHVEEEKIETHQI
ncbi:MAG: hypothetical protein ACFFDW_08705 [Candidatus Thorarchaeota archaeon]